MNLVSWWDDIVVVFKTTGQIHGGTERYRTH